MAGPPRLRPAGPRRRGPAAPGRRPVRGGMTDSAEDVRRAVWHPLPQWGGEAPGSRPWGRRARGGRSVGRTPEGRGTRTKTSTWSIGPSASSGEGGAAPAPSTADPSSSTVSVSSDVDDVVGLAQPGDGHLVAPEAGQQVGEERRVGVGVGEGVLLAGPTRVKPSASVARNAGQSWAAMASW